MRGIFFLIITKTVELNGLPTMTMGIGYLYERINLRLRLKAKIVLSNIGLIIKKSKIK